MGMNNITQEQQQLICNAMPGFNERRTWNLCSIEIAHHNIICLFIKDTRRQRVNRKCDISYEYCFHIYFNDQAATH